MRVRDMMKRVVGSAYAWWVGAPRPTDQSRRVLLLGLPTTVGAVVVLGPDVFTGLMEAVVPEAKPEPELDIFEHANRAGLIIHDQYNGLGAIVLQPGESGILEDTYNRALWAKAVVLDSDDPPSVLVESVTIAGTPIDIGPGPVSLSAFSARGAEHLGSPNLGMQFDRRLGLRGQKVVVIVRNIDCATHVVSGGLLCDDLSPHGRDLAARLEVQACAERARAERYPTAST